MQNVQFGVWCREWTRRLYGKLTLQQEYEDIIPDVIFSHFVDLADCSSATGSQVQ